MDSGGIITILSSAYEYTQDQSIAEYDDSSYLISVVPLKMLEEHLQNNDEEKFQLMVKTYQSLANFLIHNKTKDLNKRWKYGIVTQLKFKDYCYISGLQFTRLKCVMDFEEDLFAIHRIKKQADKSRKKSTAEERCQEVFECSQNYFLNEEERSFRENIKNTFNCAVQMSFPNTGVTVELIGASKYQLDSIHENLKLAVRSKGHYGHCVNLNNKERSFYDAGFLSHYLESMGVKSSNIDRCNNGCSFIGLGVPCHIRVVNDDTIIERDQLILEYLKLDKRVKPLVCAILHFFNRKQLSKYSHPKLLDPSGPIVMVLDFLANGLKYPLIPNLRNLDINCKSSDCLYNILGENHVHTGYHTCLRIENNEMGKKYSNLEYDGIKPNIWNSYNGDNLTTLLKSFFMYYSKRENFFRFLGPSKNHTVNDISSVNYKAFKNCKAQYSWFEVSSMFLKAFELLKKGNGFEQICSEWTNS